MEQSKIIDTTETYQNGVRASELRESVVEVTPVPRGRLCGGPGPVRAQASISARTQFWARSDVWSATQQYMLHHDLDNAGGAHGRSRALRRPPSW